MLTTYGRAKSIALFNNACRPQFCEERERRFLANEAWREQCRVAQEEMRREHLREEATKLEVAKRQAAIVQPEQQRKARRQREDEISQQVRDREVRELRLKVTQQEWWQRSVEQATRNAVAYQNRQTLLNELENMINPPAPPEPQPEPEIDPGSPNIGDDNYNPRYVFDRAEMLRRRRRSWWDR